MLAGFKKSVFIKLLQEKADVNQVEAEFITELIDSFPESESQDIISHLVNGSNMSESEAEEVIQIMEENDPTLFDVEEFRRPGEAGQVNRAELNIEDRESFIQDLADEIKKVVDVADKTPWVDPASVEEDPHAGEIDTDFVSEAVKSLYSRYAGNKGFFYRHGLTGNYINDKLGEVFNKIIHSFPDGEINFVKKDERRMPLLGTGKTAAYAYDPNPSEDVEIDLGQELTNRLSQLSDEEIYDLNDKFLSQEIPDYRDIVVEPFDKSHVKVESEGMFVKTISDEDLLPVLEPAWKTEAMRVLDEHGIEYDPENEKEFQSSNGYLDRAILKSEFMTQRNAPRKSDINRFFGKPVFVISKMRRNGQEFVTISDDAESDYRSMIVPAEFIMSEPKRAKAPVKKGKKEDISPDEMRKRGGIVESEIMMLPNTYVKTPEELHEFIKELEDLFGKTAPDKFVMEMEDYLKDANGIDRDEIENLFSQATFSEAPEEVTECFEIQELRKFMKSDEGIQNSIKYFSERKESTGRSRLWEMTVTKAAYLYASKLGVKMHEIFDSRDLKNLAESFEKQ